METYCELSKVHKMVWLFWLHFPYLYAAYRNILKQNSKSKYHITIQNAILHLYKLLFACFKNYLYSTLQTLYGIF